jgi:GNAT superfamily N-acetyltransferase
MNITTAQEQDIPLIVELLKKSLGESLLPKSVAYWHWKHVGNPFGASPVLLAWENNQLIGVRAFMRWRWQHGARQAEAVRAVDTATHPDHQGKGIFKKLTLALVEQGKAEGWNFVFNTPNNNSKPGYLKMGWQEAGKLPIHVQLLRPASIVLNTALKRKAADHTLQGASIGAALQHTGVPALLQAFIQQAGTGWVTPHTRATLRWRYEAVPVVQYAACSLTQGNDLHALAFYRLKPSRAGVEFRVADLFTSPDVSRKAVAEMLEEQARVERADYLTASGCQTTYAGSGIRRLRSLKIGPIVITRTLATDMTEELTGFRSWNPSLGDLELF